MLKEVVVISSEFNHNKIIKKAKLFTLTHMQKAVISLLSAAVASASDLRSEPRINQPENIKHQWQMI